MNYTKTKKICLVCEDNLFRRLRESYKSYENRKYCSRDCYLSIAKPPSRKNIKHTEKTKEKMRKTQLGIKGYHLSDSAKENISEAQKKRFQQGGTVWNKGLTKETDERVFNLAQKMAGRRNENRLPTRKYWRGLNKEAKIRDNHMCGVCGYEENLDVHHIVPWARVQEHKLDNLITLCKDCHKEMHKLIRELKFEDYKKQLNENLIQVSVIDNAI